MARDTNELVRTFNLKEHVDLFNAFLRLKSDDDIFLENYDINGKKFSIYKKDNYLIIQCEDGRILNISLNNLNNLGDRFSPVTSISFDYLFDGNKLSFSTLLHYSVAFGCLRSLSFDELTRSYMFSIEHRGEPKGLIVNKYENGEILEGVVSSIEVFDNDPKLIFLGNGTIMYNGTRLTEDGTTITEFKGNNMPSREEVFSYDLESEKAKLRGKFAALSEGLHPATKKAIGKDIETLGTRVKYIAEAKDIYDQYTRDVQGALVNCERFNYGLSSQLFSGYELHALTEAISKKDSLEKNPILAKKRND